MTTIILLCANGMSTSMLAKKMKEVADAENFNAIVEAHPIAEAKSFSDVDVILLGPQVRFREKSVRELVNCPVGSIDMRDYGTMNAKAVLEYAKKLMQK